MLTIDVVGTPAPQGSKNAFYNPRIGRAVVVDKNPKQLRGWREAVKAAAAEARQTNQHPLAETIPLPVTGPVEVAIRFYMPRPMAHFRTGKHAGVLKDTAPLWCDKRPDLDKCVRSTCDALTEAGIYRDDNQIVSLRAEQQYTNTGVAGAHITITPLDSSPAAPPLPRADAPSLPAAGEAPTTTTQEALL